MSKANEKMQNVRNDIGEGRQKVVQQYMQFYDKLIKDTILRNNQEIYNKMKEFCEASKRQLKASIVQNREQTDKLSHLKVGNDFSSQVPTALVITSSESASSIET